MPVVYNMSLRDARMQAVIDAIDDGTGPSTIEIGDGTPPALGNILCIMELEDPSFALAAGTGVISMTLDATSQLIGTATADGFGTSAQIKNGNGQPVVTGLRVGTSTTTPMPEIVLNSATISDGQTVSLTQGEIVHA